MSFLYFFLAGTTFDNPKRADGEAAEAFYLHRHCKETEATIR
jgi:hypothetical protein